MAPPAADPVPLADTLVTPAPQAADPVPLAGTAPAFPAPLAADASPAEGAAAADNGDSAPPQE